MWKFKGLRIAQQKGWRREADREKKQETLLADSQMSRLFVAAVQLLSCVQLLVTPMDCSTPGFPVFTVSWNLLKLLSIESVMPSSHLILCHPLLLPPSIFPIIRVFSNESALHIRWPKYFWSFSFNISPSSEHLELISLGWTGWISLQSKGLSRVFSNTTVQKHQFSGAQLSL